MAELLVMAFDKTNSDATIDARDCYKKGDIVRVMEDGTCTEKPGPISDNQPFYIIKIPDVSVKECEHLDKVMPHATEKDHFDRPRMAAKRRWRFDLDGLDKDQLKELKSERWITLKDSANALALLVDKSKT